MTKRSLATPRRALSGVIPCVLLIVLAAAGFLGAGAAPARADAPWDSTMAADTSALGPIEYLWVLRNSLVNADDIPKLVERARAMKVKGIIVQVVGRGDGWYRSDLLPYPEPIRERGRDPLGELVPLAHAAGIEVHAWMNCCLVWSGKKPPSDPRHVIRQHPEWVARLEDGRPMTRMSPREREKRMVEGVFLSPAHPGVRTYLANVAREIASRYPVDGIHLDYIRQPSVAIGFDPTSRARFAMDYGVDPAMFGRLPQPERMRADSAWSAFQLGQVTAIVREVRDSLNAVRPGIELSAAVLADTLTAVKRNRQAWSAWLRDGLLDRAFAMCYAPLVQTVMQQLSAMSSQVGTVRLVPGIAIYNTSPSTAAAKIRGARELGFGTVALYSYDSLWERQDLWDRLRSFLLAPRSPEETP